MLSLGLELIGWLFLPSALKDVWLTLFLKCLQSLLSSCSICNMSFLVKIMDWQTSSQAKNVFYIFWRLWENKDCAGSYLWPQTSNLCCPWEKVCGLLLWMLLNFTLYNWFSATYFRWVLGYFSLFILLLICWVSWPYWFTIFKKFGRFSAIISSIIICLHPFQLFCDFDTFVRCPDISHMLLKSFFFFFNKVFFFLLFVWIVCVALTSRFVFLSCTTSEST